VAAALTLVGCTQIPTSGPVQAGDGQVPEPDSVVVLAEGPQLDSPPERIVGDFLLAGAAGLSGGLDFDVARQYLYGDALADWDPRGGVLVASGTRIDVPADSQVTMEASVRAKVDADGRYSEAVPDARETVTFDLVQDTRGQWRIADLPDGLVLSPRQFSDHYRSAQLFFLTPDETQLVPEVRYYPASNLPTSVVRGLLAGPSPWLRDAVRTAVPVGVELTPAAVLVDANGVAEVDLGPPGLVQSAARDLLVAQVTATLKELPQVRSVVVRAGVSGVQIEGEVELTTAGDAELAGGPEMLLERVVDGVGTSELVALVGGRLVPVANVGPLTGLDARSPARSEDGSLRVLLDGPSRLVLAPAADAEAVTLLEATGLAEPSVDRYGWVWTASASQVLAVDAAGTPVQVAAPWLADREVRSVRVSRDGTRIAVISEGEDGGTTVDVAGVVRDEVGGPLQLSEQAPRAGAALTEAEAAVWIDDTRLAVLARGPGSATVWIVPVGGQSLPLPEVAGAVSLAGGRLEASLLVATEDGVLVRLDDPTWVPVPGVAGVRTPSYPG
jgi:hypothetical protein